MLDSIYTKLAEVDSLPISYGYIANKACYITFDDGDVQVYQNNQTALEAFQKLLRAKLRELQHKDDELPF